MITVTYKPTPPPIPTKGRPIEKKGKGGVVTW